MNLMSTSHRQMHSNGPSLAHRDQRFKRVLTITLIVSVLVLFASSLLTAWFIGRHLENTFIAQIDRTVGTFADNAVNVFLLDDPRVARSMALSLASLPTIQAVVFLGPDYTPLFHPAESESLKLPLRVTQPAVDGNRRHWEDGQSFHFLAAVSTDRESTPFERSTSRDKDAGTERLGFVYAAADSGTVRAIKTFVLVVHALVVAMSASALLLWFRRRVRLMDAEVALMTAQLREAYNAALTADRHKDQFLAIVTHELRQPLSSIMGFTELSLQEMRFVKGGRRAAARMQVVLENAGEMLRMVEEILAFAKVAGGKVEVRVTAVDVEALATRAAKLLEPALLEQGNQLEVHTHGVGLWGTDGDKLFHIVTNVLSNACKFTQEGTIALSLFVKDHELHIVVTDTGIGIAAEHQGIIFEPFRQVDMNDTRCYGGTGMGLAITKNYCELLGGTINVESTPGIGSTFKVCVPVQTLISNTEQAPKTD